MLGTMIIGLAALLVLIAVIGYTVIIYNSLVMLKKNVKRAWKNIDVLLKQRHDEIPKLIDTAKEYMEYEESVLKEITEKRTEAEKVNNPKKKAEAENKLNRAINKLFAVAEDYPDLKATESFQQLQERISSIEDQIADRREFYNSAVTTYNTRINQIPYNVVASILGYKEEDLYKVPESEKEDIDISKAFEE